VQQRHILVLAIKYISSFEKVKHTKRKLVAIILAYVTFLYMIDVSNHFFVL
jgi:hypothetical protein